MKTSLQRSAHLRSGRQNRILHQQEAKVTTIYIRYYSHAGEGKTQCGGHQILHTITTIMSHNIGNTTDLFWLDKWFCKDVLYKSKSCEISIREDLFWYMLHCRHHTIFKCYCKGSMYKPQPSLTSDNRRCRLPFGNYRKFSLWTRVRDYREVDQIINCNHF